MSTAAAVVFTPQDLASHASKVFDAVRRFGSASIRTQEGETFVLAKPETSTATKGAHEAVIARMDAHARRLKELGNVPPLPAELERIHKIIAGEI